MARKVFVLTVFVLLFSVIALPAALAESWQTATVESSNVVGSYTSIAVDSNDMVHVSYYNATGTSLKYANCSGTCNDSANWDIIEVDNANDVGMWSSIDVDSNGVYISYYDNTNQDLYFANCTSVCNDVDNWETTLVDDDDSGEYSSIGVDSDGILHISYFYRGASQLKYANCTGSCGTAANWAKTVVDDTGGTWLGDYSDLAIDSSDDLHISYHRANDVFYATCTGDCATPVSWTKGKIDAAAPGATPFTSIAVDSIGEVHIMYYDSAESSVLIHANCSNLCTAGAANWDTLDVDITGDMGKWSDIVIDDNDVLHVSYYDDTEDDLEYANCSNECEIAANWDTDTIDSTDTVGEYSAIDFDSSDNPHISYYAGGVTDDLKYAGFLAAPAGAVPVFSSSTLFVALLGGMLAVLLVSSRMKKRKGA